MNRLITADASRVTPGDFFRAVFPKPDPNREARHILARFHLVQAAKKQWLAERRRPGETWDAFYARVTPAYHARLAKIDAMADLDSTFDAAAGEWFGLVEVEHLPGGGVLA